MSEKPGEITVLLQSWRSGNKDAEEQLFCLLMPELRKIAGRCFRGERAGHTIQPTALVNEAFFRLAAVKNIDWQERGQFLAISATIMRRLLIDHARARPHVQFQQIEGVPERFLGHFTPLETLIELGGALDDLGAESRQKLSIVELKYVLGLTDDEVAEVLKISVRSMQRQWHEARVWLFERMEAGRCKSKTTNA